MERLININDIKERYISNPEPKEINTTRKLIEKSFSKLSFIEDGHKYFLKEKNGEQKELPSVSSIIEQWVPYVNWDEKAEAKALKLGISSEELKKQWHENNIVATTCGSKTHFFGENLMNMFIGREKLAQRQMPFQYTEDGYLIPYCGKEWAIMKYYCDILDNSNVYPVMPEAKIYMNLNDTFKIKTPYAGTFDILMGYKINGKIVYSIHDFKTNADIYKDYSRNYGITMLEPFNDLYEEAWSHYAIQLSLYSLGLKQLGLEIVDRVLIWLKDDGTYEKVRVPDLTKRLLEILQ